MRGLVVFLVLGALAAIPGGTWGGEPDGSAAKPPEARDQLEALRELHDAESDEEAEAAMQRFDDASRRELEQRRDSIDFLIEK